jgi:hypothetical protein
MTPDLRLRELCSPDYVRKVAFVSTPTALRAMILRTQEFQVLARDLVEGRLTEAVIEEFVNGLFKDFRKGERFPHEEAVATIVVLLERHPAPFAEKFIQNLAELRSSEMTMAVAVARESLRHRSTNAQHVDRAAG